jgi:hypothetical protein
MYDFETIKSITCLHALNVKYYTYICMHSRQNTPEKKKHNIKLLLQ